MPLSLSQLRNSPRLVDALVIAGIVIIILTACLPAIVSGNRIVRNGDLLTYAARHEFVRQSVLEHATLPQRSHLLGGGYPTIGDPEDPTLTR